MYMIDVQFSSAVNKMNQEKLQVNYEDEVDAFRRAFVPYTGKKKVLYGTGRKTAVLNGSFDKLGIIGLTDRDVNDSGKEKYGIPLLTRAETESQADMLVINTVKGYWTTIYNRIRDWNIPIYFADGSPAEIKKNADMNDPYWSLDAEMLAAKIKEHDIILFDIFDTLLARKVYFPGDVFELINTDLLGIQIEDRSVFSEARKKAESLLDNPNLEAIYRKLSDNRALEFENAHLAEQIEKDTDEKLLVPRTEMVRVCNAAMQEHDVYFVSDMYYGSDILLEMLHSINIPAKKEQIIVSCEHGESKKQGGLWKLIKERFGKKIDTKRILHIGDDELADEIIPIRYNIDTFRIKSCREIAEKSSLKIQYVDINDTATSVIMGFLVSRLFNDPFCLKATKGTVSFSCPTDTGFYLLGGPAYSFSKWLCSACKEDRIKRLCFVGRDGYLLKPQFDHYLSLIENKSISTSYFESSRILLWNVSIRSESDIATALRAIPFSGTYRDLFKTRLNIEIDDDAADMEYKEESPELDEIIAKNADRIIRNAFEQRLRYTAYLQKVLYGDGVAIVDISYYGSIQFYINRLLGKNLPGYYMTACMKNSNPYFSKQPMKGCFGNDRSYGDTSNFLKRSTFMESFYTSPYGSIRGIGSDGIPLRLPVMRNQKNFAIRQEMQEGIFRCMDELHTLEEDFEIDLSSPSRWNSVFEMFMDGGFEPSEREKQCFWREDLPSTSQEFKVWE